MDQVSEARAVELDSLGAHFKFQDLSHRLTKVINESRQEKRSYELLMY